MRIAHCRRQLETETHRRTKNRRTHCLHCGWSWCPPFQCTWQHDVRHSDIRNVGVVGATSWAGQHTETLLACMYSVIARCLNFSLTDKVGLPRLLMSPLSCELCLCFVVDSWSFITCYESFTILQCRFVGLESRILIMFTSNKPLGADEQPCKLNHWSRSPGANRFFIW